MCRVVSQRALLFGKRFENIKWTVSTAERQLTYLEDSPKDNNTYAEDGSTDNDIDIEGW